MPRLSLAVLAVLACLLAAAPRADAGPRARASVVGGQDADIAAYPYMAALVVGGADAKDGQFCGAAIVAPDALVTAAHCVTEGPPAIDAIVGRTALDTQVGDRIPVVAASVHPNWNPSGAGYDVAVVRLQRAITQPQPIAVANPSEDAAVPAGTDVRIAGWGLVAEQPDRTPDSLQQATLRLRSSSTCQRAFRSVWDDELMRCASSPAGAGPPDACRGDSGGPLVVGDGPSLRLLGIVSFGGAQCAGFTPSVYTRAAAVADFIADRATRPITDRTPTRTSQPHAAVEEIGCTSRGCYVDASVIGSTARVDHLVVRVRRGSSGCITGGACRKIDRRASAKRRGSSRRRWRARIDLPFGVLRISVAAVDRKGHKVGSAGTVYVSVFPR